MPIIKLRKTTRLFSDNQERLQITTAAQLKRYEQGYQQKRFADMETERLPQLAAESTGIGMERLRPSSDS
jgi:hypothetical protein